MESNFDTFLERLRQRQEQANKDLNNNKEPKNSKTTPTTSTTFGQLLLGWISDTSEKLNPNLVGDLETDLLNQEL